MRKADRLVRDLRNLRLIGGGRGCIIFTTTNGEWLGREVGEYLEGAAHQLGFGLPGDARTSYAWHSVADAIVAGCLPDLLSEAIEAAEALFAGEQEQAEAAE